MTFLRILFVLCFGFFIETAFASKAYDELIRLHNLKIKAITPEQAIAYNDQIHGILGGSKGFSKKTLTSIEKSNTTYIAIHAAITTSGTGEDILLQKVTPSGLEDSINSKIINHYVNLIILYLATKSAESSENPENFKLVIEGGIARLS